MHPEQVNLAQLCQIFRIDKHVSQHFTEQVHKETEGLEKECREACVTMWSVAAFTDALRMHSSDVSLCCKLLMTLAHPTVAEPNHLLTPSRVCTAVLDALSLLRVNQDLLAAVFIEMDRRGEVACVRHMARLVCRSFFHSIALPYYESEFVLFIGRLLELVLLPGVDPRQVLFGESSAFANLLGVYVDHSPTLRAFLDSSLRVPLLAGLSSADASFELGQTSLVGNNNGDMQISSTDQQTLCRQIIANLTASRAALPEGFVWLLSRVSSLLSHRFTMLSPSQPLTMCAELAARCLALAVADPFILNIVDDFLIASPHSITLLGQVANLLQRTIVDAVSSAGDQSREITDLVAALFPTEAPSPPDTVNDSLPLSMLLTGSELRLLIDSCRSLSAIQSEAAGRLATYVAAIPLTVLPQASASSSKEASSPLCTLLASDVLLTFPPLIDVYAMVGLPDRQRILASDSNSDYQQQQQQQHHHHQQPQNGPAIAPPPPTLALRWYARRRRAERTASTHSSGSADERRMRPMEKRTRFMLTVATSAAGDIEPSEAASTQFDPSEAASTHSCVSLDNDGSLSDMSGRATPDVSGRDTPLSAPAEPEQMSGSVSGAVPVSIASSIQGSVVSGNGGFAVPNAPTPRGNRTPGGELRLLTSGGAGGGYSAGSLHSNRAHPTDDVTEKFGKFDIKPEILAASAKAPSDTWSTDVLASEADWAGSEPGGEDSSRWSVEPEADDAPSISEIEHEQGLGSSHGCASQSSYGAAAADDIDDEEMMMMVAAADANRFENSGSTDWGEPPAVPESATASWSMLFRPIAPAYDELSDTGLADLAEASDRASTGSARESFGASGLSGLQFGGSASQVASHAMSRIKNPFKQLGDKLKKGKRKATTSSTKQLSSAVAENEIVDESGVYTGTLKPSGNASSGVEAPADILRKYERTTSTSSAPQQSIHSMSAPSLAPQQTQSAASTPVAPATASNVSSPQKMPSSDSKQENVSAAARHSSTTNLAGSTFSEQMLMAKMRSALTNAQDPSSGVLASLQRATAVGSVAERAVAREALRGYKQSISNGSADQLMTGLLSDSDSWPNYYTHLLASLLNTISMRARTNALIESFRMHNDGLVRCLATRLAAVLLMGDAERRLLDDTSNRFRAVQMDERTDVVLAMTERITASINQWLSSWASCQGHSAAVTNLRHVTLYQVERVFFSRNYTAGLLSAPSFRICQENDERFAQHVARLSVVLTADHPALALPQPLQRDVPWPAVQFHIRQMGAARHPLDKAACLCDAITSLSRLLSVALQGAPVSSDHQLPALVLVLVRANVPHLLSTRTYIQTFIGMADIQSIVIQSTSPSNAAPAQWPWRHSPEIMRFAFAQFATAVAAIQQLIQQLVS